MKANISSSEMTGIDNCVVFSDLLYNERLISRVAAEGIIRRVGQLGIRIFHVVPPKQNEHQEVRSLIKIRIASENSLLFLGSIIGSFRNGM